jgi:hypothetical protein
MGREEAWMVKEEVSVVATPRISLSPSPSSSSNNNTNEKEFSSRNCSGVF